MPLIGPGCSQLTSCTSCLLSSRVTECGWCHGRCTRASQCPASSGWTQDYCTPVITKVTTALREAQRLARLSAAAAAAPPHSITIPHLFQPVYPSNHLHLNASSGFDFLSFQAASLMCSSHFLHYRIQCNAALVNWNLASFSVGLGSARLGGFHSS